MSFESLLSLVVLAFPVTMPNAVRTETKPQPTLELHAVERLIIQHTNAERKRYGLAPLVADKHLIKSARTHATWMTTRQTLTHTNQPVAENIAYGQESAAEAVRSWMNSAGHRANILHRGHRRIGVAAFVARNGRIYWCQQFLR
ncbi:MAG TPA: CAP domain-containing protein [Pirellulales bacterium]|nr:CAP domain-containing protein [Pirellulales bacterium]